MTNVYLMLFNKLSKPFRHFNYQIPKMPFFVNEYTLMQKEKRTVKPLCLSMKMD